MNFNQTKLFGNYAFFLTMCLTVLCEICLASTASAEKLSPSTQATSSSISEAEIIDTKKVEKRQVAQGKAIIELMKTGKSAFIGRLTLAAHAKVPQHRDPTEEYLLIEQGQGLITIDGKQSKVKKGDLIYMPAHAEVSFTNGGQKLLALQIFAGPKSALKYNKWQPVESKPTP